MRRSDRLCRSRRNVVQAGWGLTLTMVMGGALAGAQQAAAPHGIADPRMPRYAGLGKVAGDLNAVGTDTMMQMMTSWIIGFTTIYPQVRITMQAKGSLTAAPALTDGSAQIAPLSREMLPSEIEKFKAEFGYEPTAVKVALGSYATSGHTIALTFFVNEANPISKLNFEQLDAMYCTGLKRGGPAAITKWGQLGLTGEWADRDIHLVGVHVPDGISNFIRLRVCQDGSFRPGIHEEETGGPVNVLDRIVSDVAADPAAIGYAGFSNGKPGSKPIGLAEASAGPYMKGTFAEVAEARFPLTRYVYLYVNRAPGKPLDPVVREFCRYVLSLDGQKAVEREGVSLPLSAEEVKKQRDALN